MMTNNKLPRIVIACEELKFLQLLKNYFAKFVPEVEVFAVSDVCAAMIEIGREAPLVFIAAPFFESGPNVGSLLKVLKGNEKTRQVAVWVLTGYEADSLSSIFPEGITPDLILPIPLRLDVLGKNVRELLGKDTTHSTYTWSEMAKSALPKLVGFGEAGTALVGRINSVLQAPLPACAVQGAEELLTCPGTTGLLVLAGSRAHAAALSALEARRDFPAAFIVWLALNEDETRASFRMHRPLLPPFADAYLPIPPGLNGAGLKTAIEAAAELAGTFIPNAAIPLDLAELEAVAKAGCGRLLVISRSAAGPGRAKAAANKVLRSLDLKEAGIRLAGRILINFTADADLKISEFEEASACLKAAMPRARIKFGLCLFPTEPGNLKITMLAGLSTPKVLS